MTTNKKMLLIAVVLLLGMVALQKFMVSRWEESDIARSKRYHEQKAIQDSISKQTEIKTIQLGEAPVYMVELHFTPSTTAVANFAMNEFSISVPMDRRAYDTLQIGNRIGRMVVINKYITSPSQ